jgi:predicted ATPase
MAAPLSEKSDHALDERTKLPFLRRARIRGYKSIAFCDVQLQPLTILVGRNAAGKSNFLDALAFLRDVMKVGVADAVNMKPRGGWSSLICRSAATSRIEIEIETDFACGRPFQRISDELGSSTGLPAMPGELPNLTGVHFTAIYRLEFSLGPHSAPIISKELLDIVDESNRRWTGFEVHNGDIQGFKSGSGTASELLDLPDLMKLSAARRPDFPLLSFIGTQPYVELGEGLRWMAFYNFIPDAIRGLSGPTAGQLLDKHGWNLASIIDGLEELEPESVQRVGDYLTVIAPEIENFTAIRLGAYETVRFRLRGDNSQETLEFDAGSMSDGTLRALAALMAAFQVVLPRGYPSVVGIEEPESALHPAAMRALVDALDDATQRTQVLLTTHSADLLSGRDVRTGQVLVVRNRGGKTYITAVDKASREIIQKELYTLAELQRMDKLDVDEADLKRQAQLSRQGGA